MLLSLKLLLNLDLKFGFENQILANRFHSIFQYHLKAQRCVAQEI